MICRFLIILLLLLSSALPQIQAADSDTISLKKVAETATTVDFILEANQIKESLIGISATIKLAVNVHYQSFEKGTFFEKTSQNITYLSSPRKTNIQEIIIGIVSLEAQSTEMSSGTIILIHCTKSTATPAQASLQNTTASGVKNNQRYDYQTITWLTLPKALPDSGSNISWIILISGILACINQVLTWLKTSIKARAQTKR